MYYKANYDIHTVYFHILDIFNLTNFESTEFKQNILYSEHADKEERRVHEKDQRFGIPTSGRV